MNFYSLAKRTFFSRNLICLHHACVQLFRAKIFAFREEKTLVESGLNIALSYEPNVIHERRKANAKHFVLGWYLPPKQHQYKKYTFNKSCTIEPSLLHLALFFDVVYPEQTR